MENQMAMEKNMEKETDTGKTARFVVAVVEAEAVVVVAIMCGDVNCSDTVLLETRTSISFLIFIMVYWGYIGIMENKMETTGGIGLYRIV